MIPELGWPPGRRDGRGFRRAHVWSHFCASLRMPRRWSLCLEGLYRKRRSAPLVRLCSARLPRDRALVCSGSLCFPLRPPGCSPAEALFESAYDTRARSCHPLRMAVWPRGQWAPLDADMFELIDRSPCHEWSLLLLLVEPHCSYPVLVQKPASEHVQRCVRSTSRLKCYITSSMRTARCWSCFGILAVLILSPRSCVAHLCQHLMGLTELSSATAEPSHTPSR